MNLNLLDECVKRETQGCRHYNVIYIYTYKSFIIDIDHYLILFTNPSAI